MCVYESLQVNGPQFRISRWACMGALRLVECTFFSVCVIYSLIIKFDFYSTCWSSARKLQCRISVASPIVLLMI